MFGALKRGRFRSLASLILVVNVVGELQQKRTLAALERCNGKTQRTLNSTLLLLPVPDRLILPPNTTAREAVPYICNYETK